MAAYGAGLVQCGEHCGRADPSTEARESLEVVGGMCKSPDGFDEFVFHFPLAHCRHGDVERVARREQAKYPTEVVVVERETAGEVGKHRDIAQRLQQPPGMREGRRVPLWPGVVLTHVRTCQGVCVDAFRQQVGASDGLSENLMGRSTGSTGEAYGSGFSVERSNEALQKINPDEFMPNRILLRL